MDINENKCGAPLTDENLEDILKASTTNIVLEYEKLIADKMCDVSQKIRYKHKHFYCLTIIVFFIYVT
jgi:hypothetical protein